MECGEEFCSGTCKEFQYDAYQRLILPEKEKESQQQQQQSEQAQTAGKKSRKSGRGKRKSHRKKKKTRNMGGSATEGVAAGAVSQMPVD